VRRLASIGEREMEGLIDVLIDCVDGGASVNFMHPMTREKAQTFWRKVAAGLERGDRALIVAEHGKLKYPEGTACAEVLKAGADAESRAIAAQAASPASEQTKAARFGSQVHAPSGTAITLAEQVIDNLDRKRHWTKEVPEGDDTFPIIAHRIEDVPGTHNVKYSSDIDEIEIIHTAHSRKGFALGAVLAAEYIADKKGIFTMQNVLNLQ
jgi:hypothetical protein